MTNSGSDRGPEPKGESRRRLGFSLVGSGASQFSAQAVGILLAVLASHLIARRMGIGAESDAFLLGRRLITSVTEALNQVLVMVFIPVFAAQTAAGMSIAGMILRSCGGALILGGVLGAAMLALAPAIVATVAPDFDPAAAELATTVIQILALCLPATVAAVALSSYCNVRGRFGGPAIIRQLPRASIVVALLTAGGSLAVNASVAFTAASFAVALITLAFALWLGAEDANDRKGATAGRSEAAIGRRGAAAAVLTVGALACIWLETAFAARQGVGGVSLLDFSQRLGALCGNTLAMALGLVAFSDLVRRSSQGEKADLGRRFQISTLTSLSLVGFVQAGFLFNARPVVDLILSHGEFGHDATDRLVALLQWTTLTPLGAVIVRMMLIRVLAESDLPIVRLVVVSSIVDFLTRFLLFSLLSPALGLLAVPVTLSVAPLAPALWIVFSLRRRGVFSGTGVLAAVWPVALASLIGCMALAIGTTLAPQVQTALTGVFGPMDKIESLAQLLASGVLGLLAFGASARLLGVKLKSA